MRLTTDFVSSFDDQFFQAQRSFNDLMDGVPTEVSQATGDGAYDAKNCWDWTEENQVRGVFPPKKNAKIQVHGNTKEKATQRDRLLRLRRKLGKKQWKKKTKYSRRSIAETAMYRFKTLLGADLNSRWVGNQIAEAIIKCKILNLMPTPAVL